MKRLLIGVAMALLSLHAAMAHEPAKSHVPTDTHIAGHVLEGSTGEHLPYVLLQLKGTTIGTTADVTGHYSLKNIPNGTYTLTASCLGYQTQEIVTTPQPGQTTEINFKLEKGAITLEQVVVSANRNETNRQSAPTLVNVLSTETFEQTASHNIAEALNYQSGLRVEYNCQNCGVPQLRINGLEGQYSQILLDSRPIFSSLASVYGLEQIPVSMVERIEVIRGGGSALFGSNAIGGVVNIITKEPIRNTLMLSHTTHLIGGSATDLNTSLNGAFVSDDHKAGVYIFGMLRDRKAYDRNGDGFSELPELNSETLGFRGYYKTGTYSRITAEYHHIREFRRGGNRMDRPPHEADIAEQLRHGIHGGGIKFDLYTPNQLHRVNLYTSAQSIDRDSYFGTQQNPDAYGKTTDRTVVAGAQYSYSMRKLLFSPSQLTVGIEYNYNNLHDQMLGYNRDMRQVIHTTGGYFQNEWQSKKVNVLIGARLDKNSQIDHPIFNPRVNVRYTPIPWMGLRASYSSGYRAPQAYEEDLHIAAVGGKVALIFLDPKLKPEYSNSFSASMDLNKSFGGFRINLLLEGFYTDLRDVFTLVEQGYDAEGNHLLMRTNSSGATVTGLNTELTLETGSSVSIQAGYTFQKSNYKEPFQWSENPAIAPSRKMLRSPDHYGYIAVTYVPTARFTSSLYGNFTGNMSVPHYGGEAAQDQLTFTPRFWDMGVKLSYDFKLGPTTLQLNGGVKNIFDSFQQDIDRGMERDAGYIYGPALPRTYFLGLKFSL